MATNPFANATVAGGGGQPSQPQSPFTNGAVDPATVAGLAETQTAAPIPEIPDINDPSLVSETLTIREGDAFAEPAPPPDRRYRVKLTLRGVGKEDFDNRPIDQFSGGAEKAPWVPETQYDKNKVKIGVYAKTIMDVQIHDPAYPQYEGLFLQVPFKWMDTRTSQRTGTSKVATLLTLLRRPDGTPWLKVGEQVQQVELIQRFVKALAGEPELLCQSEWSWSCQLCGEAAKKSGGRYPNPIEGMNKFNPMPGQPGVYNHELRCQAVPAHGFSKARAMAVQYFALPEAGK